MKKIEIDDLKNIDDDSYVWYACYGSNIDFDRLMIYINGDSEGKFAHNDGCRCKDKPIDSKPYIIRRRLYFAGHSGKWNGGVAFLNYRSLGKVYGKIYKLRKSQFLDILKQEHSFKDYDTLLYVGKYQNTPIFTFTALHKLKSLEEPSSEYLNVIKKGLISTYKRLSKEKIDRYLKRVSVIK